MFSDFLGVIQYFTTRNVERRPRTSTQVRAERLGTGDSWQQFLETELLPGKKCFHSSLFLPQCGFFLWWSLIPILG
jgi:hypothetical protein